MDKSQLDELFSWFDRYVDPFLDTDDEGRTNIQLKITHTRKVCDAMVQLCAGEQLAENETYLALAVALLHDVGRFPQYRRWRTFLDRDSDNHARLAIEVIREEQLLGNLASREQILIEEAIRFHNMLTPPDKMQSDTRRYINLIRDADKLDIWRVFVELQSLKPEERATAAMLGLPDLPDNASDVCVAALYAAEIVRLDTIACVNDFKLLQISWVYDLNCATSRHLLLESRYIEALAATLPQRTDIREAVAKAIDALSA